MRHPTFLAQAWPRLDHQVYCSGSWLRRRNTSTYPSLSSTPENHSRSSGRKPEFFWLERQFLRSISLCATFQSPQSMTSRPLCASLCNCAMKRSMKLNLIARRSAELEPEGTYTDTMLRL